MFFTIIIEKFKIKRKNSLFLKRNYLQKNIDSTIKLNRLIIN
jgi:hypothetical protein